MDIGIPPVEWISRRGQTGGGFPRAQHGKGDYSRMNRPNRIAHRGTMTTVQRVVMIMIVVTMVFLLLFLVGLSSTSVRIIIDMLSICKHQVARKCRENSKRLSACRF